jgi:hypothetical protein
MSTTTAEPTLAERVFSHLSSDHAITTEDEVTAILKSLEREPADGTGLTRREEDLREWGFLFGLAYGMADEGENRARRALDAARAAYGRWAGQIPPRPVVSPLVDDVIVAYGKVEDLLDRVAYREPARLAFSEAMQALVEAVGKPAPKVVE